MSRGNFQFIKIFSGSKCQDEVALQKLSQGWVGIAVMEVRCRLERLVSGEKSAYAKAAPGPDQA